MLFFAPREIQVETEKHTSNSWTTTVQTTGRPLRCVSCLLLVGEAAALCFFCRKRRGSGLGTGLGRAREGSATRFCFGGVQVWKCRLFFSLLQSCALRCGKTGIQLVFDVFCCVHSLLLSIQKATIYGFLLMLAKHIYRKNIQRKVIKRFVHRLWGTSCWWSTPKTPKYSKAPFFVWLFLFFCLKTLWICETI